MPALSSGHLFCTLNYSSNPPTSRLQFQSVAILFPHSNLFTSPLCLLLLFIIIPQPQNTRDIVSPSSTVTSTPITSILNLVSFATWTLIFGFVHITAASILSYIIYKYQAKIRTKLFLRLTLLIYFGFHLINKLFLLIITSSWTDETMFQFEHESPECPQISALSFLSKYIHQQSSFLLSATFRRAVFIYKMRSRLIWS